MKKYSQAFYLLVALVALLSNCSRSNETMDYKEPIDCVNPYMGNISHMLVPTYPTVHLPNSMLRIYPERADYTGELLNGLPIIVTSHRGKSAFRVSPISIVNDSLPQVCQYTYDQEEVTPYRYKVLLDNQNIQVDYAPATQSALYQFDFLEPSKARMVILHTNDGLLEAHDNIIKGYERLQDSTFVYLYAEFNKKPSSTTVFLNTNDSTLSDVQKKPKPATVYMKFPNEENSVAMRYGVSFISTEQAQKNLAREISSYVVNVVAKRGRNEWVKALDKINVKGGTAQNRAVFYTSLYRVYERMVCISEDGHYFSAFDNQVHEDHGIPFYTDDWIWDTYRAVHPLRILIDPIKESYMINSYIRMAEQSKEGWLPTFPEVTGDSHRMNGNHAISMLTDAYAKGLTSFDINAAYKASEKVMMEKSFLPWTKMPKTKLDKYMDEHGYMPGLRIGETETEPYVTKWEKRQSVAVTLAACYDYWALSQLANYCGHLKESKQWLTKSYDYRNLFNYETGFFHPKDDKGNFIQPFDYEKSGGLGARDYYDENNAYTYRWDVQHNIGDLVYLMGGKEEFINYLDETFRTPISDSRFNFYHQLPDQTGNVGQFSMANEPSMHIPYLYNYAGEPWRTQKAIKKLIHTWFRNDLMGMPGDEDGGGMSAFVVFSMMGLYPVTPGMPIYNIGTPFFAETTIKLANNKKFVIKAVNFSEKNKYIQSAELDGKKLNRPWVKHSEITEGNTLTLKMGPNPNKNWGISSPPPSADKLNSNGKK